MTTIVFNTIDVHRGTWRDVVRGMAQAFNLRGVTRRDYYFHSSAELADLAAMQNDWETVGKDLDGALAAVSGRR